MSSAPTLSPKLVGARVQRLEDPRLLTGHGRYVDDLQPKGLAHIALLRSMHAHARVTRIDVSLAQKLPGVVAVVTGADIVDAVKPIVAVSRMKTYTETPVWPLAQGKVRFVGEAVAAVVAESRYIAEDALRLIEVDYEALPSLVDPEAAADPASARLYDNAASNVVFTREFARGDVDLAIAQAAVRVSARFRFRRKAVLAIENRCYLADYDAGRRSLTLHTTTQVPGVVRDVLSELLDLPGNRLRVVAPDVGGGFGGKTSLYPEEVLVCLLARRIGRPVKWTSDRMEDLAATSQGFDEIVHAELGVAADGAIAGLKADVIGDIGAYSIYPWTAALEPVQVVSFLPGPYRIEHYRGRVKGVATCKAPLGPYRGVGRPVSTFVLERLVDMAAAELKLDPVEMRARNLIRADEFPYKAASGLVWDRSAFGECLTLAREAIGYDALRQEQQAARAKGRLLGIGFATYAELTGIGSRISAAPGMPVNTGTESATIRIDPSGAVTALFGVSSHGQGLETTLAQIIADELGARLEDISVQQGDTALRAYGTGTYASRSAVLAGGAATLAARAVREKILRAASHFLEASADDIEISGSAAHVRGTDRAISFREIARAVYIEFGKMPKELQEELEATRLYDPVVGTTSSATHACLVEVDPETWQVKVLKYAVAEDCGTIINPMIVDGQVHGGVAQGIGAALYEEVVYNEDGQLLTGSLMDYLVPSAAEVPKMDVRHVESPSPTTLGGYRGMGEGGTIGAPAAIANAVSDALSHLGIGVSELPITPERLYRLAQQQGKQT
jgi:carbon-monoxide dehydrogenase large subunit